MPRNDACSLPAVARCLITKHLDQTAQKEERNTEQGRKKTWNLTALQMPLYRMQAALLDITTVWDSGHNVQFQVNRLPAQRLWVMHSDVLWHWFPAICHDHRVY